MRIINNLIERTSCIKQEKLWYSIQWSRLNKRLIFIEIFLHHFLADYLVVKHSYAHPYNFNSVPRLIIVPIHYFILGFNYPPIEWIHFLFNYNFHCSHQTQGLPIVPLHLEMQHQLINVTLGIMFIHFIRIQPIDQQFMFPHQFSLYS